MGPTGLEAVDPELLTAAEDDGQQSRIETIDEVHLAQRFVIILFVTCRQRAEAYRRFVPSVEKRPQIVVQSLIDVTANHIMRRPEKGEMMVGTTTLLSSYYIGFLALLRLSGNKIAILVTLGLCEDNRRLTGEQLTGISAERLLKLADFGAASILTPPEETILDAVVSVSERRTTKWYFATGSHWPIPPVVHQECSSHAGQFEYILQPWLLLQWSTRCTCR